jgi:hypothetical protein
VDEWPISVDLKKETKAIKLLVQQLNRFPVKKENAAILILPVKQLS